MTVSCPLAQLASVKTGAVVWVPPPVPPPEEVAMVKTIEVQPVLPL